MGYPPLRAVEAFEIEQDGQPMILIRDPEQLCPQALLLPLPLYLIMSLLDGERDGAAIQSLIRQATQGQIIPVAQIDEIVRQFDELFLLANPRAAARHREMEQEFAARLTRPAAHAGQSYPADETACRRLFDGFFDGLTRRDGGQPRPRGLIVPHIDLRLGGPCLARGLATLDADHPPRLCVVLGVAHQGSKNLFTLTDKSFETPLGLFRTDRRAAERLRELYGAARLDGEYSHRLEHSVEFQAVALRYLYSSPQDEVAMLPILCGALPEVQIPGSGSPLRRSEVAEFVEALRRLLGEYENEVVLIASVDLSHVGRKFGDPDGITKQRAHEVEAADRAMLDRIGQGAPEAFLECFQSDGNIRNVDAVTAVYVMMQVLGPSRVELLDYRQWHEEETDSMVSFASMVLD
jgi:MEMO1 family protein